VIAPLVLTTGLFYVALFHALPAVLVAGSGRVRGNDLTLWIIAVLFTSWLGFVAFMVVTTMEQPQKRAANAALDERRRQLGAVDVSDHRPN